MREERGKKSVQMESVRLISYTMIIYTGGNAVGLWILMRHKTNLMIQTRLYFTITTVSTPVLMY